MRLVCLPDSYSAILAGSDEAALIPVLLPDMAGAILDWPHQWFWDGQEHVDPTKDATALALRLANLTDRKGRLRRAHELNRYWDDTNRSLLR